MQLSLVVILGLTAAASAAAVPAPASPDNSCYTTCMGAVMCLESWPESCYCKQSNSDTCAESCGISGPRYACPAKPTLKPVSDACKPKVCIQSWPASCHCQVDQARDCAISKGQPWDDAKARARCNVDASA